MRTNDHPEFRRAANLIEEALFAMDIEGGDVRSLATCLLVQSAALYSEIHGIDGGNGLIAAMAQIAESRDPEPIGHA